MDEHSAAQNERAVLTVRVLARLKVLHFDRPLGANVLEELDNVHLRHARWRVEVIQNVRWGDRTIFDCLLVGEVAVVAVCFEFHVGGIAIL